MIPHVVTGMPRSSTKWTAQVLTFAGIPTTHEYVFDRWVDAMDRARLARFGDCSWIAAPFAAELSSAGVPVVALVRDPLAVVTSLCGPAMPGFNGKPGKRPVFMQWVEKKIGPLHGSLPEQGLRWWVEWTRLATAHADVIVPTPIDSSSLLDVGALLDHEPNPEALELDPTNGTRVPGEKLTWDNFPASLAAEAQDLAGALLPSFQ